MPQPKDTAPDTIEQEVSRLEEMVKEIEARIQPMRDQIADDEMSVERLRHAIRTLRGEQPFMVPTEAPQRRTRRASTTASAGTLSETDKRKVVDFLGGNPNATAGDINKATGLNVTAAILRESFGDQLTTEGERRGMRYSLRTG